MDKLRIIECDYCYAKWRAEIVDGDEVYTSGIRKYKHPRSTDHMHEWDSYQVSGADTEIYEVDHMRYQPEQPCIAVTQDYSDAVYEGLSEGKAILAAGGYCNYAPAIVGGIQRAYGKSAEIGVVWIDAHADNVIVENSDGPVRLVGVPVSTMLGQTLPGYRKNVCGLEIPVKGSNMILSDIRIMDERSAESLESAGTVRLDASQFDDDNAWKEQIQALADRVDVIFLMVDADILKFENIPSYEKRVPYGHDLSTVVRNVETVIRTGKVSAMATFCFDFDHFERDTARTNESVRTIIEAAIKAWDKVPEIADAAEREI